MYCWETLFEMGAMADGLFSYGLYTDTDTPPLAVLQSGRILSRRDGLSVGLEFRIIYEWLRNRRVYVWEENEEIIKYNVS